MRVGVIGTGYVGLVSGVGLAHVGHDVTCVDLDAAKVDRINRGDPPIHEIGLETLLRGVLSAGRFRATTDLSSTVESTELTMVAVGTPFGEGRIDLGQIELAAAQIGEALRGSDRYHVVVVKSTVVPGTTDEVVAPILARTSGRVVGRDIGVGMNPEFLREGAAVADFLDPDRVVVGGVDERSRDRIAELYAPFPDAPVLRVSPRTAEMIKYASNALLAVLVSFSNEIGNLARQLGIDSVDVMDGLHLDRRWSPVVDARRVVPPGLSYLAAGCGFGGSCLPKDVKALIAHGERAGVPMDVLTAAIAVNARQPGRLVDQLAEHLELAGAAVTVLGAAFKPGTDDVRESPALAVIAELVARGASVTVHDPVALDSLRALDDLTEVSVEPDLARAVDGADAVALVTSWPEYAALPSILGPATVVVDGRRQLEPSAFERYDGIGYPGRTRAPQEAS